MPAPVAQMDSLWVFLAQHGVEPTNNRAERAMRFGVLWRKRSLGRASKKGNRWVERILSLAVLVEATAIFFQGRPPDLSWLNVGVSPSAQPL